MRASLLFLLVVKATGFQVFHNRQVARIRSQTKKQYVARSQPQPTLLVTPPTLRRTLLRSEQSGNEGSGDPDFDPGESINVNDLATDVTAVKDKIKDEVKVEVKEEAEEIEVPESLSDESIDKVLKEAEEALQAAAAPSSELTNISQI